MSIYCVKILQKQKGNWLLTFIMPEQPLESLTLTSNLFLIYLLQNEMPFSSHAARKSSSIHQSGTLCSIFHSVVCLLIPCTLLDQPSVVSVVCSFFAQSLATICSKRLHLFWILAFCFVFTRAATTIATNRALCSLDCLFSLTNFVYIFSIYARRKFSE